jgi:hypothetical protein
LDVEGMTLVTGRPEPLDDDEELVMLVPPDAVAALKEGEYPQIPTRAAKLRLRRTAGEWRISGFITSSIWIENRNALIDVNQL